MNEPKTLREASCADDYDPNSMPVERARALIRTFLTPVTATERVHIRQASMCLAAQISPLDVPGHITGDGRLCSGFADPLRRDDAHAQPARRSPASRRPQRWDPVSVTLPAA
jgi:hypothetical protein